MSILDTLKIPKCIHVLEETFKAWTILTHPPRLEKKTYLECGEEDV